MINRFSGQIKLKSKLNHTHLFIFIMSWHWNLLANDQKPLSAIKRIDKATN